MATDYTYFQGKEDDDVSYTYSPAIDVSSATLTLAFYRDIDDTAAAFTIVDADFDKTDGATGVITWPFDSDDTATPGVYDGILTAVIDADNTEIKRVSLWIKEV